MHTKNILILTFSALILANCASSATKPTTATKSKSPYYSAFARPSIYTQKSGMSIDPAVEAKKKEEARAKRETEEKAKKEAELARIEKEKNEAIEKAKAQAVADTKALLEKEAEEKRKREVEEKAEKQRLAAESSLDSDIKKELNKMVQSEVAKYLSDKELEEDIKENGANTPAGDASDETTVKSLTVIADNEIYVEVLKGNTLSAISRKFNVPLKDLIKRNELTPPYTLSIGQKIYLPPVGIHKVKPKETLFGIAKAYGLSLRNVSTMNNIEGDYTIEIGQEIILPPSVLYQEPKVGTIRQEQKAAPEKAKKVTKNKSNIPARESDTFLWPVSGEVVSSFGPKDEGKHNDGINISAKEGDTVKAAEAGLVTYVGDTIKGMGNVILIKHSDKYLTIYAHVSKVDVKKGDKVTRGQEIATIGKTGKVESVQLHFEIRKGSKAVNPEELLTWK